MHIWTNLNSIIILITFGYVGFMILWVSKKLNSRSIQNSDDFFSYPKQDSSFTATKLLERTFEATNASFTTAFLGLFALALFNSLYTFSIIVGYILGIVFFAKKLLIKCMPFIKDHKFYPFVLEEKTGDKRIRIFSVTIIILSLLFFLFYRGVWLFHNFPRWFWISNYEPTFYNLNSPNFDTRMVCYYWRI